MGIETQKLSLFNPQEAVEDSFFLALQLAQVRYCHEKYVYSIPLTYPTPKGIFISVQEPGKFLATDNSDYIFGCHIGIVSAILTTYQRCLPPASSTTYD